MTIAPSYSNSLKYLLAFIWKGRLRTECSPMSVVSINFWLVFFVWFSWYPQWCTGRREGGGALAPTPRFWKSMYFNHFAPSWLGQGGHLHLQPGAIFSPLKRKRHKCLSWRSQGVVSKFWLPPPWHTSYGRSWFWPPSIYFTTKQWRK